MYNALTSNPKALAAIAAGEIQDFDRIALSPACLVWGAEHNSFNALCQFSGAGNQYILYWNFLPRRGSSVNFLLLKIR